MYSGTAGVVAFGGAVLAFGAMVLWHRSQRRVRVEEQVQQALGCAAREIDAPSVFVVVTHPDDTMAMGRMLSTDSLA